MNSGLSPGSGGDGQAQIIGAGVIGPASAEKNCKSTHLTAKQQAICSRSPPVLQVLIYRWRRYLPLVRERTNLSFSLFGLMGGEAANSTRWPSKKACWSNIYDISYASLLFCWFLNRSNGYFVTFFFLFFYYCHFFFLLRKMYCLL